MIARIVEPGYTAGWASAAGQNRQRCSALAAARCQRKVAEAVPDSAESPEQSHICLHPALRSIAAVALVAAAAGATAPPCNAKGGEWLPRRHWRRMDDPRQRSVEMFKPSKGKRRALAKQEESPESTVGHLVEEARSKATSIQQSVTKALTGQSEEGFTMGMRSPAPSYGPQPAWVQFLKSGMGYAVIAATGLVLIFLLRQLPKLFRGMGSGRPKGRWVNDRSLGGKAIFIPDGQTMASVSKGYDLATAEERDMARERATLQVGEPARQGTPQREEEELPEWWNPSPALHVSLYYKEEAEKNAKSIVRELEDAKLAGIDYPVSSLINLRQTCGEAGIKVRPRTASGRDAMLRSAAEAAVDAAMEQSGAQLGGMPPAAFITGLAGDLDVPEEKAANIALGTVASKARAALIDACAAYREQDSQEAIYQLLRLAGLLEALPLPARSAQADLVAASISQKATLAEREAIFKTYGRMEPKTAGRVAELLGFDPELVVPQLQAELKRVPSKKGSSSAIQ